MIMINFLNEFRNILKKALEQTRLSIDDESLYPLKTDIITRDLYEKDDFIIRKLDTSKFNKKNLWS